MRTCQVVRTLAQAAFLGTLAIGSAIAQTPQTGTITGRVTDASNGQPVAAAQVAAEDADDAEIGAFRSHYSPDELQQLASDRLARWRVNPPTVLDMQGRSLLRWLSGQGRRVLLLDWGWPDGGRRSMDVGDPVAEIIVPLIQKLPQAPDLVGAPGRHRHVESTGGGHRLSGLGELHHRIANDVHGPLDDRLAGIVVAKALEQRPLLTDDGLGCGLR